MVPYNATSVLYGANINDSTHFSISFLPNIPPESSNSIPVPVHGSLRSYIEPLACSFLGGIVLTDEKMGPNQSLILNRHDSP